jgi:hypothetical protein
MTSSCFRHSVSIIYLIIYSVRISASNGHRLYHSNRPVSYLHRQSKSLIKRLTLQANLYLATSL